MEEESKDDGQELVKLLNPSSYFGELSNIDYVNGFQNVTIITSDKKVVKCHSVILASASPMFADIMRTASMEDENIVIMAENMTGQEANAFLRLICHGTVRNSQNNLNSVMELAQGYRLQNLCVASDIDLKQFDIDDLADPSADIVDNLTNVDEIL